MKLLTTRGLRSCKSCGSNAGQASRALVTYRTTADFTVDLSCTCPVFWAYRRAFEKPKSNFSLAISIKSVDSEEKKLRLGSTYGGECPSTAVSKLFDLQESFRILHNRHRNSSEVHREAPKKCLPADYAMSSSRIETLSQGIFSSLCTLRNHELLEANCSISLNSFFFFGQGIFLCS
jgi:hypothetical protein